MKSTRGLLSLCLSLLIANCSTATGKESIKAETARSPETTLSQFAVTPAWQVITQYCEDPQAIGTYDIEAIGLLWIAYLHQQTEDSKDAKLKDKLTPEEVPIYVYVLGVLSLPEFKRSQAKGKTIPLPSKCSEEKWSLMFDCAKSLVTAYSHYVTPIKKNGAFAKRDNNLRGSLSTLVGEKAVTLFDDDYINGEAKLQKLADSYINDFRLKRLAAIQNGLPDDKIIEAFNTTNWWQPTNDLEQSDIAELKRLWKTAVAPEKSAALARKQLKENLPEIDHLDRLECLASIAQDTLVWSKNLPTAREPSMVRNFHSVSSGFDFVSSSGRNGKEINATTCQLQFLIGQASNLIWAYRQLKASVVRKPNSPSPSGQNSNPGKEDKYLGRTRGRMVFLVGEENVQRLEREWEKEK
jgi:hypothetical protein